MKLYFTAKENKLLADNVKEPTIGITTEANSYFKGVDIDLVSYGWRAIPYAMVAAAYENFSQGNTFAGMFFLVAPAVQILHDCTTFADSQPKKEVESEVQRVDKPKTPSGIS